jgi:hypothetical protein
MMNPKKWQPILLLICLQAGTVLRAQTESVFRGVALYESLEKVQAAVTPYVGQVQIFKKEDPVFPLSDQSEIHLLCQDFNTGSTVVKEVVFTFADNRLVFVEAYGNAMNAMAMSRQDTAVVYMDFEVYPGDNILSLPKEDKVWYLTPEGAHTNLFLWDHPLLKVNGGTYPDYNTKQALPPVITMGGSITELSPLLKKASRFVDTQELDGSDPNAQIQLDCFGIEFAGFPRKLEARFGDNRLNVVWILTGKGEEDRIRRHLTKAFGKAIYVNDDWEIFKDWQVLLRKDKPEVLLLTPELGKFYKADYFGMKE